MKLKGNVSVTDLLDRADVKRLIAIVSVPLEEVRVLGEEHLTVRRASRIALFGEAGILMALASGHLQAVGRLPGVAGFKGMIFNRSDLVEAIQLVTGKRLYGRVLNEKGWKTGTLRYLRENGFLDADLHPGYVDVRELNAFLARHVDMGEMLEWEMPALTRREIRSILNAEGVAPVIPLGSHVTAFWPRSRARQALGARSS